MDTHATDLADKLYEAATAVSAAGLSDAFGHVSVRTGENSLLMTPPLPLAQANHAPHHRRYFEFHPPPWRPS